MALVKFYLSNRPAEDKRDFKNPETVYKTRFNYSHGHKVSANTARPVFIQSNAPLIVEQSPWYENETIISVQDLGAFYVIGKPEEVADALNGADF